MSDTDKPKTPTSPVGDKQEQVSPTETDVNPPVAQETKVSVELPPGVATLKEAFPTIDVDVVTAVLDSHQGNVEAAFDELLQLTDPAYQASQVPPAAPPRPAQTAPADDNADTPAMPPRPAPLSPEEQMRLDEEFARQLALEDERDRVRAHQRQQQQQQQQQQRPEDKEDSIDEFIREFQEELPVIKEKMIEAGMNAKKKVLDFYNQIKAKNNNDGQSASSSSGYGPRSTNTQYQGLPSSNDDDYLLSGEMTALHLSDQDVYSGMQQQRAKNYYDYQPPSAAATQQNQQHQYQSATLGVATVGQAPQVDAQILADEEFARRLARDDELWQQRQQQQQQQQEQQPPTMPPRKSPTNLGSLPAKTSPTVVVTPKSPLEEYDERDNNEQSSRDAKTEPKEDKKDDERVQSYIIGDDDSDDGLVDLDDDDDELAKTDKKATDAQKSEQKK